MSRPMRPRLSNGRPPHQPSDKIRGTVEAMAGLGATVASIAVSTGLGETTLRKYYRAELDAGMAKGDMKLLQTMYEVATKERNVAMLIFLAKTRLGMSEKHKLDVNISRSADDMTDDELLAIARRGRGLVDPEGDGLDGFEPDGPVH